MCKRYVREIREHEGEIEHVQETLQEIREHEKQSEPVVQETRAGDQGT